MLQDQRLNYVEQHAERIGVDAGRLESARVSAAKGSIMGDTLDVCARHMDAAALEALVPVLGQLLKRGVGLNAQAGAARFISSLAMRLGSDLRPQSGALLKVEPPLPWRLAQDRAYFCTFLADCVSCLKPLDVHQHADSNGAVAA